MGVVIQEMVGSRYGDRFYPPISGVALSYNYYPFGDQRPEDGIVMLALGLGQHVVEGGRALPFCPKYPTKLPHLRTPGDFAKMTQTTFYALDMAKDRVDFFEGPDASLVQVGLDAAEADGTLALVGSVYDPADDVIRDDLRKSGPRVVSFNNILKWASMPLAPALDELLETARHGMGSPVDLELAVFAPPDRPPRLYVLQIRPQATELSRRPLALDRFPLPDLLCRTDRSLGHGVLDGIRDVIYVESPTLEPKRSQALAREVGRLNTRLREEGAGYLLIGPGRWGSTDPALGIGVEWSQIAGARVIVETRLQGRTVEPSQGSHFFHNMTSLGVGYLAVRSLEPTEEEDFLDQSWLDAQPVAHASEGVRHVRLAEPLRVLLDGTRTRAVIVKPGRGGEA